MSQLRTVACLYVAAGTVYRTLPCTECWDIARDATLYAGPHPIIAHPPCGHWGRYSAVCRLPSRHCGPIAIDQVRRWGGVLEHPRGSRLIGRPAAGIDLWGGERIEIDQARFGHPAQKLTVLYVVRCQLPPLPPPTTRHLRPLENLSHAARAATPPDFAAWLLEAARSYA